MAEEQFGNIEKRNFHYERQLEIPENPQQYLEGPINKWGWQFLYQPPVQVNATLVKEFYANFCWHDLDLVFLRGHKIPISEDAIRDFYKITTPAPKGKYAFQKAKEDMATIKWDKVLKKLGKDRADWKYNNSGNALSGLKCKDMTVEARLWFQILSNYVMSSTHGSKATLEMAANVEVPWRLGDEQPKLQKKDKFISYGKWYKLEKPSAQKFKVDRQERHLKCQERRQKWRYENIKRMNKDWDLSLEEPDTLEGAKKNSDDENSAAIDVDSVDASDGGEE
ncbi:hypothetical protein PIB30_020370 [Stylosanthes scabra]|uniref:Putative plant transposon protein domain-containing protein n=1 Tax=Stylosanthes scabra TaxID=79078 RepID=A0ABU6Q8E9_9FABA|nr:hypothetical protein [Stylosanthes scabra]